jgi:hypothetical protein
LFGRQHRARRIAAVIAIAGAERTERPRGHAR